MQKTTLRRRSVLALAAGAALATSGIAGAQEANWPNRPVRIIAAFPAGSGTDSLARFYGERLGRVFGQNFVIENIVGANGAIAARAAARAAPDGYTIFFGSVSTHAANPNLMREPGYDPLRDFAPITRVANVPNMLAIHPSVPAKTVKELIAVAKARPGQLNYGSAGNGSNSHVSVEFFKQLTGTDIQQLSR